MATSTSDASTVPDERRDLPEVRSLADVRRHVGRRVQVRGRYEVTPVAGSKRLQPACIVLEDGARLVRSYRPVIEELHFDGQRVIAVGQAMLDAGEDPTVQQVMAPHVAVESLRLDPIESPFAPGATEVRTPPTVARGEDLTHHLDRWVQIFGHLEQILDEPNHGFWVRMRLRLPDGSRLETSTIARANVERLVGKDVSFVALVAQARPTDGLPRVSPAHVVCEGRVERCGMGPPLVAPR